MVDAPDARPARASTASLVALLRAQDYEKAEVELAALQRTLRMAARVDGDALSECLGYAALDTLAVDEHGARDAARVVEEAALVLQLARGQNAAAAAGWRVRADAAGGSLADEANALLAEWRGVLGDAAARTPHAKLQAAQRAEALAARVARARGACVSADEVRWEAACICLWVASTCGAVHVARRVLATGVLPAAADVLAWRSDRAAACVFSGDAVRLVAVDALPSVADATAAIHSADVAACTSSRAAEVRTRTLVACAVQRMRDDAAWADAAALLAGIPAAAPLRAVCQLSLCQWDTCAAGDDPYVCAVAHMCAGRWADAQGALEALVARGGGDTGALTPRARSRAWNALAVVHGMQGRLLASIGALKRALQERLCAVALHNAVQVYAALGSHASHRTMLSCLLEAGNGDDEDTAQHVAAVLALPEGVRAAPTLGLADQLRRMHDLARLHCARGEWTEALAALDALEARVAEDGAWGSAAEGGMLQSDRAHVLLQLQRYEDCLAYTTAVLKRMGGEHVPLLMHRADALLCSDRPADALAAVDTVLRVLAAHESNADTPNRAAKRPRRRQGRAGRGVDFSDAACVRSWRVRAYCNRAVLLCCVADGKGAAAALRAALNADPECIAAAYNLTLLLHRQGHTADACSVWLDHRRLASDEVGVLEERLRAATAEGAAMEPAREHVRGAVSAATARKLDECVLRERVDALLAQRREVLAAELFADLDDSAFDFALP